MPNPCGNEVMSGGGLRGHVYAVSIVKGMGIDVCKIRESSVWGL